MAPLCPAPDPADVRHALESLDLSTSPDPLTDESTFASVACTLAEEVDHTQTFIYDISAPPSHNASAATYLPVSRGFSGSPKDRSAVLDFLAAEAQSARLAARAAAEAVRTRPADERDANFVAGKEDEAAAAAFSSMAQALSLSVADAEKLETVEEFNGAVAQVLERVREALEAAGGVEALGAEVVGKDMAMKLSEDKAFMQEAETIREALASEHQLRKGLLLRRLEVTVQSFGYSGKVGEGEFSSVLRGVKRVVEQRERDVSVLDALVARDWLLESDRVSGRVGDTQTSNEVKRVLMGGVPDRGGRVGSAAALKANVPTFSKRQEGGGGGGGGGRGRGRGRKSRGKGRKG